MADDPKASVLGELAHELLQPLTGIRSSAELLLEARPGDAAVAPRVAHIRQQGRRGRIRIRTALAGKAAEAIVEDDGPGVPEELRPRLFARLATARSGGSGLGLYISRALAEEAGGSLELLDAAGGAKFRLRLPSAPAT